MLRENFGSVFDLKTFNVLEAVKPNLSGTDWDIKDHHEIYIPTEFPFSTNISNYGFGVANINNFSSFSRAGTKGVYVAGQIVFIDLAAAGNVSVTISATDASSVLMTQQGWQGGSFALATAGSYSTAATPYTLSVTAAPDQRYFFFPKGTTITGTGGNTIDARAKGEFIFVNVTSGLLTHNYLGGYLVPWDGNYRFGKTTWDFNQKSYVSGAGTVTDNLFCCNQYLVLPDKTVRLVGYRHNNYALSLEPNELLFSAQVFTSAYVNISLQEQTPQFWGKLIYTTNGGYDIGNIQFLTISST